MKRFDRLAEIEEIVVYELVSDEEVSDIVGEVIDIDYGNIQRFTDEFALVGKWWQDRSYAISELRKQVKGV